MSIRNRLIILAFLPITAAVWTTGCSGDMYSGDNAKKALEAVLAKMEDPNPKVMMLKITPKQVTLHAENRKKTGTVQKWWYYKDQVGGPKPVKLIGDGLLADNVIDLNTVNLGAIPKIVADVKSIWEYEKIKWMSIKARRNVTTGGLDFYWSVDCGGRSVEVPLSGAVPLPLARQIPSWAKEKKWMSIIKLCDRSTYRRDKKAAAACDDVISQALAVLSKTDSFKARMTCQRMNKVSDAYREACSGLGHGQP